MCTSVGVQQKKTIAEMNGSEYAVDVNINHSKCRAQKAESDTLNHNDR